MTKHIPVVSTRRFSIPHFEPHRKHQHYRQRWNFIHTLKVTTSNYIPDLSHNESYWIFFPFPFPFCFCFRTYLRMLGTPNCPRFQPKPIEKVPNKGVLTLNIGYSTRSIPPTAQAHRICLGRGSVNWPLLHFVITSISVRIVARRSHTCCPIRLAFLTMSCEEMFHSLRSIHTLGC